MKRLKRNCEGFVGITERPVDIGEFLGFTSLSGRKRGVNESALFGLRFMAGEWFTRPVQLPTAVP